MRTSYFLEYAMTDSITAALPDDQLLRIGDVAKLTTLSKSCIHLWVAQRRFPPPLTLSPTVKVWRMAELRAWTNSQLMNAPDL